MGNAELARLAYLRGLIVRQCLVLGRVPYSYRKQWNRYKNLGRIIMER